MVANGQLDLLAAHRFAGRFGARLQRDDDLGRKAKPDRVSASGYGFTKDVERRFAEVDDDFGGGCGQLLAGSDQERDAGPAKRIELDPEGCERLHGGFRRDARLVAVAVVLPAHDVRGIKWSCCPQYLGLGGADVVVSVAGWRLYGE